MPLDPSIIQPNAALLQSIANPPNPLEIQARAQALQNQRLQSQSLQMGIQQQQREIEAQTLMGQAYQKAYKMNPDGTASLDPQAMSDVFTQGNRPDLIPGMVASITQQQKTAADLHKAQADATIAQNNVAQAHADHMGSMAVGVQQSGYSSDAVKFQVQDALNHGFITPQEAQQINAKLAQDPTPAGIQSWVDPIIAGNPAARDSVQKIAAAKAELAEKAASTKAQEATAAEKQAQQPGTAAESALKDYSINALPGLRQAFAQGGAKGYETAYNAAPAKYQMLAPKPGTKVTDESLAKSGMTDKEQTEYDAKQQELKMTAQRNAIEASKAKAEMAIAAINQGDRETKMWAGPFQAAATGAQTQLQRISEAQQMLTSGSPTAQAAAIPKVLQALLGGPAAGIRIPQSELNAIGQARGLGGNVQATLQRWYDGGTLTSGQSRQLQALLADAEANIANKMTVATQTMNDIENAPDHDRKKAAAQRGRGQLNMAAEGTAAKTVTSQQLQTYATQKGISVQQAGQEFKNSGYTVTQ